MNGSTPNSGRRGWISTVRRAWRFLTANWSRLLADLVAVGLWTFVLVLVFLATGWPRWAFYALLVGGVAAHAWITPSWRLPDGSAE